MSELLHEHICACLPRTFLLRIRCRGGQVARGSIAPHAQCWEEDEVDLAVVAAGVKKALAPWLEVTAFGRVEVAWSSLKKYFALNASIECVFRDSRGRFKGGPAYIIRLMAG